MDNITTLQTLKDLIRQFMDERDWNQFHSPKNLSMQIAVEAAELMELFMWVNSEMVSDLVEKKRDAIEQEIADIAIVLLNFCNTTNIDLASAIKKKMVLNAQKYPIEKAKGNSLKYTEF